MIFPTHTNFHFMVLGVSNVVHNAFIGGEHLRALVDICIVASKH